MKPQCDPSEIALKTFFLGPQAENAEWVSEIFISIINRWYDWRRSRFPCDGRAISSSDQNTIEFLEVRHRFQNELELLISRLEGEIPKFSPRYIGHMFSEISLPALFGHLIALLHNPNNISGESSRVGVMIENEAIGILSRMVGFEEGASGHFTSGGTIANMEGMHRARLRLKRTHRLNHEDAVVLVPAHAHYSWKKATLLLGFREESLWRIKLDHQGKLCQSDLEAQIQKAHAIQRPVLMVVSVAGSTELGNIDPISQINRVLKRSQAKYGYPIWHHVDAAYGGFFCTLLGGASSNLSSDNLHDLASIKEADSVTIDPHKLGYVPFSSGVFLCRSKEEYESPALTAPYIDFDRRTDKGHITIEGSRAATGAAATYLTAQCIGLNSQGYGRILNRTLNVCRSLKIHMERSVPDIRTFPDPETNILCFCIAKKGERLSESNSRNNRIVKILAQSEAEPFYVSKTDLHLEDYGNLAHSYISSWNGEIETDRLTLIRLCIMNPFLGSRETDTDFIARFSSRVASVARQLDSLRDSLPHEASTTRDCRGD